VATRAVTAGVSFAEEARDLGEATAEVHQALAAALPTVVVSEAVLNTLADSLIHRVDLAVAEVDALADVGEPARKAMDEVRRLTGLAALQRVHGDYHLGQVLQAPNRGWLLLDFEGEPLRPLAQRLEPDLAMRDVAGMLRSFDYAARQTTVHLAQDDPAVAAARQWAETACAAFLAGYSAGSGIDLVGDPSTVQLLRALELDKALYEVVYETRNRPDWVAIPMGAVHRLVDRP
jgi:predicted trehalose synthase